MAEYVKVDRQTVAGSQPVIFDTAIDCPRGNIYHRDDSGVFTLKGKTNNCFGGTAGEISVGIVQDGEVLPASIAISTPAAVQEFNSVTSVATITVPKGCCFNIAVENTSVSTDATTLASPIDVQNATLVISRIA